MEAIISQFLTVLKFNHYFIIDRLRENHSEQRCKEIVIAIMNQYQKKLAEEYERKSDVIFTYETYTNYQAGVINVYEQNEPVATYTKEQIKDVQIVAFYHKVMPFADIIALSTAKKGTQTTKKYRNKNFQKEIYVNPKPDILSTPQKKDPGEKKITSDLKKTTAEKPRQTTRKLMIDSESQQISKQPEKHQRQFIRLDLDSDDSSFKEDLIIQSIFSGKKESRQPNMPQREKTPQKEPMNPNAHAELTKEPATPLHSKSVKKPKKPTSSSKTYQNPRDQESQSLFMQNWMKKTTINDTD